MMGFTKSMGFTNGQSMVLTGIHVEKRLENGWENL